ncbi:MAG: hypothetical protein JWM69_259, partial [Candidatus Binatus sp.]|nr:hypothetical protein [Candidatus Binatus sp.]
MNRLRRVGLTARGAIVGIAIMGAFLAIAALAISKPATAVADVSASRPVFPEARQVMIERVATVDPMRLGPPIRRRGISIPLRVPDLAAYQRAKAAVEVGVGIADIPQLISVPQVAVSSIQQGFIGLNENESCGGCEPPDTQVAAGSNHVFEVDNTGGRIFDKTGAVITDFDLTGFFHLGTTIFVSDPRIVFDTGSNRWFVSILSLDTSDPSTSHNGQINLAVSTSSDPTQSFNVYKFPTPGSLPDQPRLGFSDDKVALAATAFSCSPNCNAGSFQGGEFVIVKKADLVAGAATIATDTFPPDQSNQTVHPARSRSSTSTLYMTSGAGTTLTIWALDGVPGALASTSITTSNQSIRQLGNPPDALQMASRTHIDTGDSRILDAVYRDGLLWTSATSSCLPSGDSITRSCLRYIEVQTSDLSVLQDFDLGTTNTYNYYPSVEIDSSDNLVSAFTRSSASEFPSAYVTSRLANDPVGQIGAPVRIKAGLGSYGGSRWGDYSGSGIDPSDTSKVWVAAEYSAGSSGWGTWIAEVAAIAPSGTPTSSATPSSTPTATQSPTPTSTATVIPPTGLGKLRVNTLHLDFHGVAVNATKSKNLKVKNFGKGALNVT